MVTEVGAMAADSGNQTRSESRHQRTRISPALPGELKGQTETACEIPVAPALGEPQLPRDAEPGRNTLINKAVRLKQPPNYPWPDTYLPRFSVPRREPAQTEAGGLVPSTAFCTPLLSSQAQVYYHPVFSLQRTVVFLL